MLNDISFIGEELDLLKEINILDGILPMNPASAVTKLLLHRLYSEGLIIDGRPRPYSNSQGDFYYMVEITQEGRDYINVMENKNRNKTEGLPNIEFSLEVLHE